MEIQWKNMRSGSEIYDYLEGENLYYRVIVMDYSPYLGYLLSVCPKKQTGQKWSQWVRNMENYKRYFLNYRMVVTFHGDDDLTLTKEFIYKLEAEEFFLDIITCSLPPTFDGFS